MTALLEIQNLSIYSKKRSGLFPLIQNLTFSIQPNEVLALLGESGSGKTLTLLALLGLLPFNIILQADCLRFDGRELQSLSRRARRKILGRDIGIVFQDPRTSLNPSFTIGFQMREILKHHLKYSTKRCGSEVLELLQRVGLSQPDHIVRCFPHQLSGGTCQRIMIAMALACQPKLLIADEPTTALDPTLQSRILKLLQNLQDTYQMGMLLITHDIGVVAALADRVMIIHQGQQVEMKETEEFFSHPSYPYTANLIRLAQEHILPMCLRLP